MKQNTTGKLVFSAMCTALGVVLPMLLHGIPNAGSIFLPMHIPVLLCGLSCGWMYGLCCGILSPLLSSLLTGMPGAAYLPAMLCELAAYGFFAGLFARVLRCRSRVLLLYLPLLAAMLCGRAVYGLVQALLFSAGSYSFAAFFSAAFVTALPGIVIQLVLIPLLLFLLERGGALKKAD